MLLGAIAIVGAFIAWLAWSSRQPPLLPDDAAHRASANAEPCLSCHGDGGPAPRSAKHPLGDECLRCHGVR
jgi:nitrate reductase cytochrome c-type subunit